MFGLSDARQLHVQWTVRLPHRKPVFSRGACGFRVGNRKRDDAFLARINDSVACTWSHFLSDIGALTVGSTTMNARCYGCEMASDPSDRKHVLIINHVYQLPVGRGHRLLANGVVGHVVGSWQIDGIWSVMSGTPLSATLSTGAGGWFTCGWKVSSKSSRLR